MMHVKINTVPISLIDYSIDISALESVITSKTKAIVICTPNNPTEKVYTQEELLAIGEIAAKTT